MCEKELNELVDKEEVLWRQRSKCLWLKEGDRNTKFFHTMASNRRKNNLVVRIMDDNGEWKTKEENITKVFLDYF